jgi:hypothetical protein
MYYISYIFITIPGKVLKFKKIIQIWLILFSQLVVDITFRIVEVDVILGMVKI